MTYINEGFNMTVQNDDLVSLEKTVQVKKLKLNISHDRTCDCKPNHINCLTPKEWVKAQVAIWSFNYEKRDIRDKHIHPAVFPIGLPKKCIELFTHKGELVLDPFAGIGTTLLAAQDTGRNAVGFDLKKEYVKYAADRLKQKGLSDTTQIEINDDAHNISKYLENETVTLCVTSPPYANMLNKPRLNKSHRADKRTDRYYLEVHQYSNDTRDLGQMEHDEYAKNLTEIYKGILPLMKPKAHCVINVNDVWENNKRYPTHIYVVQALQKAGFELRNILIWDKRDLVNGVGIFGWPSNYIKLGATFEYILDFWKPPETSQ